MKVILSTFLFMGGIIGIFPAAVYLIMASAFAGFGNSEVLRAIGYVILCSVLTLFGWLMRKSVPFTNEINSDGIAKTRKDGVNTSRFES